MAKVARAREEGHRDSKEGRRKRTVFVSNLNYATEEWQLEDFMSQIGEIDYVRVPRSPEGRSKGFAFVQFKDEANAIAAIEKSGIEFNGRIMNIRPQERQSDRREREPRGDDFYGDRY